MLLCVSWDQTFDALGYSYVNSIYSKKILLRRYRWFFWRNRYWIKFLLFFSDWQLVVTGWGVTERGMRSPDLLQAKLPTMNNEQCRDVYKRLKQIWYKQICAGGRNNVDSCVGDSGGPLQAESMYNNNAARMVQYGIVSYGPEQCGIEGLPGVYTNVAYYMDWILDIIRE